MSATDVPDPPIDDRSSPLYDALEIASWSIPAENAPNQQGTPLFDVVDASAAFAQETRDDGGSDSLIAKHVSRCQRIFTCCRKRKHTAAPSDRDPISSFRCWHMTRRGSLFVVGTFDGIQCITFDPNDGRMMKKSHVFFEPIRSERSFESPKFLDLSSDSRFLAFIFSKQLWIYDCSEPLTDMTYVFSMPVNGTVVAVQFLSISSSVDPFVCVVAAHSVVYVIDLGRARIVKDSFFPRHALSDTFISNFTSFVTEYSMEYALEHVSAALILQPANDLVVIGPRSDPLPHESVPPAVQVAVSSRMTALSVAIAISDGKVEFRSLKSALFEDAAPVGTFTPSRRLAKLLGQTRSLLSHASPRSILDVAQALSPNQTLVATLDTYGHISMWTLPSLDPLGSIQLPAKPIAMSFWSDSQLALALDSGSVGIWNIQLSSNTFRLVKDSLIADEHSFVGSGLSLSSVHDDPTVGLFLLQSSTEYLQARRSWPEAQSESMPSTSIIERTNFTLRYLQGVTPAEALSRYLFRNQFDEALMICSRYRQSPNPVRKRQWLIADATVDNIDALLKVVSDDLFWQLEQCRLRCGVDVDAQRHLLQFGISLTDDASKEHEPDDELLWAYRLIFLHYLDLLETFVLIQSYDLNMYLSFRLTSLTDTAIISARAERISTLQVLLFRHASQLQPHIYQIVESIPETTPVSIYSFLIPTSQHVSIPHRANSHRPTDWVESDPFYLEAALANQAVQSCEELRPWIECMTIKPHPFDGSGHWFVRRALQIESISGLISNALDLLRIGLESCPGHTDLRQLHSFAQLFASLVYEWDDSVFDHTNYSLAMFYQADPVDRLAVLLLSSTEETIVDDVRDRVPEDHRGDALRQYIVEHLAPRRTAAAVALVRSTDIVSPNDAKDLAKTCIAESVADPADIASLRSLADLAKSSEASRWIACVEISARRQRPHPPRYFASPDAISETLTLVHNLIADEVGRSTISKNLMSVSQRYLGLLNDIYAMVGPASVPAAQELFLLSVLENSQFDMARHFATLMDQNRWQQVALSESRRQFNLAQVDDPNVDPFVLRAKSILALCDSSAEVAKEQSLHLAWGFLFSIGMRQLKPIEIRSAAFRPELTKRFISHCLKNTRATIEYNYLHEFAASFGITRANDISRLLMQCATDAIRQSPPLRAFADTVASQAMASRSYLDGWRDCMSIGSPVLMPHMIWACPDSEIMTCISMASSASSSDDDRHHQSINVGDVLEGVLTQDRPRLLPAGASASELALASLPGCPAASLAYLWQIAPADGVAALDRAIGAESRHPTGLLDFAIQFSAMVTLLEAGHAIDDVLFARRDSLVKLVEGSGAESSMATRFVQLHQRAMQTAAILKTTTGSENIDVDRLAVDAGYVQATLQDLAGSTSMDNASAAITLAPIYHQDQSDLFARHLITVFRSIQANDALEVCIDQVCARFLGRTRIPGAWFERVLETVAGSDHHHLSVLYRIKSREADLSPAVRSRLFKHITILERLDAGEIVLDYKRVLAGGVAGYLEIRSAINDRSAPILVRLADRLRELQEAQSLPVLTQTTIIVDYLVDVLLSQPPTASTYTVFEQLYGQYLCKLSLADHADIIRKISECQLAVDFMSRFVNENVSDDAP